MPNMDELWISQSDRWFCEVLLVKLHANGGTVASAQAVYKYMDITEWYPHVCLPYTWSL